MNDDELRARLRAADPAREIDERGINGFASWIDDLVEATVDTTEIDGQQSAGQQGSGQPRTTRRWALPAAAAAAVVALVAGGLFLAGNSGDQPGEKDQPTVATLAMPAGDSMMSCIAFEVQYLRPMEVAFDGTVTAVDGDRARLDVNRWYKGGDADVVDVTNVSSDLEPILGGTFAFEEGGRYLVTATEGTVNVCGFSGPWTQELADAFDEAF